MKVKECMSLDVCYCKPDETIKDVAKLMSDNHIGCVPVCDDSKKVVGLVTDRDIILRSIACEKDVNNTPVSEIMTTSVCCVDAELDISNVIRLMSDLQVRRIPVIENETLVGIVTIGDLVNEQKISSKEVSEAVEGICNCKANCKNAE